MNLGAKPIHMGLISTRSGNGLTLRILPDMPDEFTSSSTQTTLSSVHTTQTIHAIWLIFNRHLHTNCYNWHNDLGLYTKILKSSLSKYFLESEQVLKYVCDCLSLYCITIRQLIQQGCSLHPEDSHFIHSKEITQVKKFHKLWLSVTMTHHNSTAKKPVQCSKASMQTQKEDSARGLTIRSWVGFIYLFLFETDGVYSNLRNKQQILGGFRKV
jgi:hypothetical protein